MFAMALYPGISYRPMLFVTRRTRDMSTGRKAPMTWNKVSLVRGRGKVRMSLRHVGEAGSNWKRSGGRRGKGLGVWSVCMCVCGGGGWRATWGLRCCELFDWSEGTGIAYQHLGSGRSKNPTESSIWVSPWPCRLRLGWTPGELGRHASCSEPETYLVQHWKPEISTEFPTIWHKYWGLFTFFVRSVPALIYTTAWPRHVSTSSGQKESLPKCWLAMSDLSCHHGSEINR